MDAFNTISLTLVSDNAPSVNVPSDEEGSNGQGGGTYCVVFAKGVGADLPSDEEGSNGQGGGTYCTIA